MSNRTNIFIGLCILAFCITGCGGLAHTEITVPVFEVVGEFNAEDATENEYSVVLLTLEYYGESGAFISLLKDKFEYDSLYQWEELTTHSEREFHVKFKEERRYIGFMIPFVPSKATMEQRTLFISIEELGQIYRIVITGDRYLVKVVDKKTVKNALPPSLMGDEKKPWFGPREKEIEQEIEFYDGVKWKKTDLLRVVRLERGRELDKIHLQLNLASR